MERNPLHAAFEPLKAHLPAWLSAIIRSTGTALLAPVMFGLRSGHFRSSFARRAVARDGSPLPWYTYPCIDFLAGRDYAGRRVLEFGGGQSTLWWARRAQSVVTFEEDAGWAADIRRRMPSNVWLSEPVDMTSREACVAAVRRGLASAGGGKFDIVVVDGLHRHEASAIARDVIAPDGAIVCDDSQGYGFYEDFREAGFARVDFFGPAPGVVFPHCTSIYFPAGSFLFDAHFPITMP